jgi:glycosyltransferase involved in cell wall biosynthesis
MIVQNMSVPLDRRVWLECQALVAAGFGVSVICPRDAGAAAFQELDGVRIHKYAPAPLAEGAIGYAVEFVYCWLRTAVLAARIFVTDGFGAVQACNPPDTYFALGWLFKLFGCRFVYDQHDLCPELYQSRGAGVSTGLLAALRALERATYRTADAVIVTNESYRAVAYRRGGLGPADVTTVRSGPDETRMHRGDPVPELKRGRNHLCCYLGIMGPQDGVDLALQAIAILVHELGRTDCQFALLGYGDCLEDLRRSATELDIDDWVDFTGRADARMVTEYLSTADLGIQPDPASPLNDVSTMNKTMEYMAFGVPVVTFDLPETRFSAEDAAQYVAPNDTGLFAKAIDELLDDPEKRAAMAGSGRRRIEDALAWKYQIGPYVQVYRRLLGSPAT